MYSLCDSGFEYVQWFCDSVQMYKLISNAWVRLVIFIKAIYVFSFNEMDISKISKTKFPIELTHLVDVKEKKLANTPASGFRAIYKSKYTHRCHNQLPDTSNYNYVLLVRKPVVYLCMYKSPEGKIYNIMRIRCYLYVEISSISNQYTHCR